MVVTPPRLGRLRPRCGKTLSKATAWMRLKLANSQLKLASILLSGLCRDSQDPKSPVEVWLPPACKLAVHAV